MMPDPAKQAWLVFFNPLVEQCFVMIEDEALELVAEIRGGAKGAQCSRETFGPLPQPDRINMSIRDKI
jgi:hypothetical protein